MGLSGQVAYLSSAKLYDPKTGTSAATKVMAHQLAQAAGMPCTIRCGCTPVGGWGWDRVWQKSALYRD